MFGDSDPTRYVSYWSDQLVAVIRRQFPLTRMHTDFIPPHTHGHTCPPHTHIKHTHYLILWVFASFLLLLVNMHGVFRFAAVSPVCCGLYWLCQNTCPCISGARTVGFQQQAFSIVNVTVCGMFHRLAIWMLRPSEPGHNCPVTVWMARCGAKCLQNY